MRNVGFAFAYPIMAFLGGNVACRNDAGIARLKEADLAGYGLRYAPFKFGREK